MFDIQQLLNVLACLFVVTVFLGSIRRSSQATLHGSPHTDDAHSAAHSP